MKQYLALMLLLSMMSCTQVDNYIGNDIKLFKGRAWVLAKAVEKEDVKKIIKIIENDKIPIDYQEEKFGMTLLMWSVITNRYESAETLLKLGANPNLQDNNQKTSALMFASDKFETSKFLKLLLKFGGNPNSVSKKCLIYKCTPLIAAAQCRLESVTLLVDAGANINFMTKHKQTALSAAIRSNNIDIAYYLIVEKNADFMLPVGKTIDNKDIFIVDILRTCVFPLDSKEYKTKMQIVDYMFGKGVNYWNTPIPKHYYKNYDSIYLSKY